MRIWLLGGFRVSVGDRIVGEDAWRLRKAKTLIKILALAPNHRLHREQVMDLLWPDLSPGAAANNLHRTLHAARRALAPASSDRALLRLRDGQLALCPDGSLLVDVEAFEDAARSARRGRDPAAYRAAVELYAGDLLPEDLYEDWAAERREALRVTCLDLLLELAALREERGEYGAAIEALRTVLESERTREEAHLGLMRLYALSGRRHAALEQYGRLLESMGGVGVAPGPAARRLYGEILAGRFPPLEGVPAEQPSPQNAPRHNLPAALTSFVGREREMLEVERLLAMTRLLTLTGTGGSGKTRLALKVAEDLVGFYPDGVWFVELAPLAEAGLVARAVAGALGVPEEPGRSVTGSLTDHLRSKELLLVLDNCEHLVDAAARVTDVLLSTCPQVRVLATSREALGVAGEIRYPVPPLALPDPERPAEELGDAESVRLFIERALYRPSTFAPTSQNIRAVAEICRRLDGVPLAIELAASRVGALAVEQISARLSDALDLLTGGSRTAPPRQRSLRGALDWSHDLLAADERRLFGRLSVFAGGFSLEAAEAVGSGDGIRGKDVLDLLSGLVDKSLVLAAPAAGGALRYGMLEPVRQYARDRLEEDGEAGVLRSRHAAFFLDLAERAELRGPAQEAWLRRLEAEHDNLRAALRWALERRETEAGLRLAGALGGFWTMRGHFSEGSRWLEAVLKGGEASPEPARARALLWAGHLAREQGDYERAAALGEESLELSRKLGDRAGEAVALFNLGMLAHLQNDNDRAAGLLEEALALHREVGDTVRVAQTLQALGAVALVRGDYARAVELHEEALALARETKDAVGILLALGLGAVAHLSRGDLERARSIRSEGLELARRIGHGPYIAQYLHISAVLAGLEGRLIRAARLWGAAEALRDALSISFSPVEAHFYGPHISAVREGLGEEPAGKAWGEGRAMNRDEAVWYALSEGESLREGASPDLSPREREVARLVAGGLTNRRIAEELYISKRTVDNHVRNILKKLGLGARAQVAEWAREHLPEDRG